MLCAAVTRGGAISTQDQEDDGHVARTRIVRASSWRNSGVGDARSVAVVGAVRAEELREAVVPES